MRLMLRGRPLVEHVLARVSGLGEQTLLITNRPESYAFLNLPTYTDIWPGKGPLGGLYTALVRAQAPYVLTVAADMPFLSRELLAHMASLASEGVDVVVPCHTAGIESLHAVYGKTCIAPIRAQLEAGRRRVVSFYDAVRVRYVDEAEIARFDPEGRTFFNVNTPADLEAARQRSHRHEVAQQAVDGGADAGRGEE